MLPHLVPKLIFIVSQYFATTGGRPYRRFQLIFYICAQNMFFVQLGQHIFLPKQELKISAAYERFSGKSKDIIT